MRRVFPAILLACFAVPFFAFIAAPLRAETGPGRPEEFAAGQALAEHLRSAVPEENSEFHGRLIIKSEGAPREIPIVCRVTVNPTTWETDYETAGTAQSGAERLVVLHSTNGPNQYLYARAASPSAPLSKPAPVPAADVVHCPGRL